MSVCLSVCSAYECVPGQVRSWVAFELGWLAFRVIRLSGHVDSSSFFIFIVCIVLREHIVHLIPFSVSIRVDILNLDFYTGICIMTLIGSSHL